MKLENSSECRIPSVRTTLNLAYALMSKNIQWIFSKKILGNVVHFLSSAHLYYELEDFIKKNKLWKNKEPSVLL